MTARISARNLVKEGWQHGLAALGPNLRWLGLFAAFSGLYSWAINSAELNGYVDFGFLVAAFGAGTAFSWRLYTVLLKLEAHNEEFTPKRVSVFPFGFISISYYFLLRIIIGGIQWVLGARTREDRNSAAQLAHANLAVYLAFLFIGFFVGFFLLILPGILIEAQGKHNLTGDAPPELVQQAFLDMLPTPYGALYLIVAAAGFAVLAYFALRLTLYGAATIDKGKAHVFITFPWTRGQLKTLGLAALATHVLPFAAGLGANAALRAALPDSPAGQLIEGAAAILLFTPFLLAGHGMAAAAHRRLRPEATAPETAAG